MSSEVEKPDFLILFWVGNSAKNEARQAARASPLVGATWAMSGRPSLGLRFADPFPSSLP